MNNSRNYLLFFLTGVVVTLVPTFLYINTLKKDDTPPFHFVPNAIAYPKPRDVQIIKTQEQLDRIRQLAIHDESHEASIGAVIAFGGAGLEVLSKEEIHSPGYQLIATDPKEKKAHNIEGFHFIPDAVLKKEVRYIQILSSEELGRAREDTNLLEKDTLEEGAAVYCPKSAKCFVIPKANLQTNYEKVTPFSKLQEFQTEKV